MSRILTAAMGATLAGACLMFAAILIADLAAQIRGTATRRCCRCRRTYVPDQHSSDTHCPDCLLTGMP